MVSSRVRAEGYVGQVGAFIGLTHHVNWYPPMPLVKSFASREPRPTKLEDEKNRPNAALAPLTIFHTEDPGEEDPNTAGASIGRSKDRLVL